MSRLKRNYPTQFVIRSTYRVDVEAEDDDEAVTRADAMSIEDIRDEGELIEEEIASVDADPEPPYPV